MINKKVGKWGSWSLGRTITLGVFVSLIFAFLRAYTILESGFESRYFNIVDTVGFITLILISSKYKGGIFSKVIVFILIMIASYISGLIFAFLGFTALLGLSSAL